MHYICQFSLWILEFFTLTKLFKEYTQLCFYVNFACGKSIVLFYLSR